MRLLRRRGYTVFAVCHGCMPKFEYKEIVADIHRAVRYVRHHAADWRVDPQRLGISGASAGGNLSLVIATGMLAPKPDPESDDPVEHESSAIQAVRPSPQPQLFPRC